MHRHPSAREEQWLLVAGQVSNAFKLTKASRVNVVTTSMHSHPNTAIAACTSTWWLHYTSKLARAMAAFMASYRLLPRHPSFCTPLAQQCRLYALSRFPHRTTGFGRNSRGNLSRRSQSDPPLEDRLWTSSNYEEKTSEDHSQRSRKSVHPTADPEAALKGLLVNNDELVVTR